MSGEQEDHDAYFAREELKMRERDMTGGCSTCNFFSSGVSSLSSVKYKEGIGECRRHAPRGPVQLAWSRGQDETHIVTLTPFPIVPKDDWCGEYVWGGPFE